MYSKRVMELMNEQIKHELYSAYLYLSMSAYFEAKACLGSHIGCACRLLKNKNTL